MRAIMAPRVVSLVEPAAEFVSVQHEAAAILAAHCRKCGGCPLARS